MVYDVWVRADDGHWVIFETALVIEEAVAVVTVLLVKNNFEEVTIKINRDDEVISKFLGREDITNP